MSETPVRSPCTKCGRLIGSSSLLIGRRIYHPECSPYVAHDIAAEVICCQGPPVCDRTFEESDDTQREMAACPWCKRILVGKDGSETTTEPAMA